MILPLPVKKNKFGQRVADISVNNYYRQIAEEVWEAHEAAVIFSKDNEAEELVDVITCCVTRLYILPYYEGEDFNQYLCDIVDDASYNIIEDTFLKQYDIKECYSQLFSYAMQAFSGSVTEKLINASDEDEELLLANIIALCVKRLNFLGYDEDARQKLYQAVNDKNKLRGYFED